MKCSRCASVMFYESHPLPIHHCLFCGNIEDPTILLNRAVQRAGLIEQEPTAEMPIDPPVLMHAA